MIIDFYFDYLSAFGYLARGRLVEIAAAHGAEIVYRPCELAALKRNAGNTGPAVSAIPAKLAYVTRDFQRWAAFYGLPILAGPAGRATGVFNRGTYLAAERGEVDRYAEQAWACIWRDGIDCGSEEGQRALERRMAWPDGTLPAYAARPEVEARYATEIAVASARGVFGVPTFIVGEEMWWGNDRLDFLDRHLATR